MGFGEKPDGPKAILYQFQLRIAGEIAHDTAGGAWIPAFAGMTDSGNRQSINRIDIRGLFTFVRGREEPVSISRAAESPLLLSLLLP